MNHYIIDHVTMGCIIVTSENDLSYSRTFDVIIVDEPKWSVVCLNIPNRITKQISTFYHQSINALIIMAVIKADYRLLLLCLIQVLV